MAWTAPKTFTVGAILTSAELNTHLRDNLLETAPAKSTAAGDMTYATGANALARLPIGSAGQVLQVSSGGTAPEWSVGAVPQLLKSAVLGTTGTIDWSSIPAGFRHLRLVFSGRVNYNASGSARVGIECNGDTATNYEWTDAPGAGALGTTAAYLMLIPNINFGAGVPPGLAEVTIGNYAGAVETKPMAGIGYVRGGSSASMSITQYGGAWLSTAPINRLTLVVQGASSHDFTSGTVAQLYGLP